PLWARPRTTSPSMRRTSIIRRRPRCVRSRSAGWPRPSSTTPRRTWRSGSWATASTSILPPAATFRWARWSRSRSPERLPARAPPLLALRLRLGHGRLAREERFTALRALRGGLRLLHRPTLGDHDIAAEIDVPAAFLPPPASRGQRG